jgi:rhodanese-related sulfurtransferase
LYRRIAKGEPIELIDVRTPGEFQSVSATSARSVPLDRLQPEEFLQPAKNPSGPIYVMCHSGARGRQACQRLIDAGCREVINVEGGTQAWIAAGLPVRRGERRTIPLDGQARIIIGLMILGFAALTLLSPYFLGLVALMAAGLIYSGMSGNCMLATILARAPWNAGTTPGGCSATGTGATA